MVFLYTFGCGNIFRLSKHVAGLRCAERGRKGRRIQSYLDMIGIGIDDTDQQDLINRCTSLV